MPNTTIAPIVCNVPITSIAIPLERQRTRAKDGGLDVTDLLESIRLRGVLVPIIITHDFTLIAGERRLEAAKTIGLDLIPARFFEDLDEVERKIIEWEENFRRKNLPWQDNCKAIADMHETFVRVKGAGWTQEKTAETIGLNLSRLKANLRVAKVLSDPQISGQASIIGAETILARRDERQRANAMADILAEGSGVHGSIEAKDKGEAESKAESPPPPNDSVLNVDFLQWVKTYSGPPFSLIHCDFPFGVEQNKNTNYHVPFNERAKTYRDTESVYWDLVEGLCSNLDKLLAYRGHLVFWFGMKHYSTTLAYFQQHAPSLEFGRYPYVWLKSDNSGLLPAGGYEPRRIYETAFIANRNDAKLLKLSSNGYSAPVDKMWHPATKPEPVLRHLLAMVVDETTTLLDPTCGGGSALRAAESLGARQVLGLELDPDYYENAKTALSRFRLLRKLA